MKCPALVGLASLALAACENAVVPDVTAPVGPPRWATTVNVPGDYSTIQQAHDAASSGDIILVAPGTYVGQITITKAITLASQFLPTGDPSHIAATILDGGGRNFVIEIPSGAEPGATIQGVTIQNADDGITPRAPFNLRDCRIRDTSDGVDYEDGSGGLVQNCTFELNGDDGIDLDNDVALVIADNVIRNNGDDGIEIRMQSYSGPTLNIIIRRNEIYGNDEDGIQLIHYDVLTDRFFEISYNYIYGNAMAGIGMMDGSTTTEDLRAASIPETIYIFNNTFANNDHGIAGGDATVVLNNIFVGHPAIAVKNVDGGSALAFNLFYNNGTDNSGSNVDVGSSVLGDPLLTAGLELSPGSPAIDRGTAHFVWQGQTVLDLPSTSYAGTAPDVGAFEFQSGTGPPPDSPTLISPGDGALDVGLTPTLTWSGDGDGFRVQIATDDAFTEIVEDVSVPVTSYTVTVGALQYATVYRWRVNASNANGTSGFSTVRTFTTEEPTDTEAPNQPQNLMSAGQTSTTVDLVWDPSADNVGVSSYNVYRDDVLIANESNAGHAAVGLTPATTYTFQVSALDAAGNESLRSADLVVTTDPSPEARIHVRNITMQLRTRGPWNVASATISIVDQSDSPIENADVRVQWSGLTAGLQSGSTTGGDVRFDSERVSSSQSGQFIITVTDVSLGGFVYDPALNAVTAACIDTAGNACPVDPDTDPPASPTLLVATGNPGSVSLSWDDNTEPDLAGYAVYRWTTGNGPIVIAQGLTSSQYTDPDVIAGTTYSYVVTAVDMAGNESAPSNEVSATPSALPQLAVHIADISLVVARRGQNYFGSVTVSVVDQNDTPTSGVEVQGSWSWNGTHIGTGSGVTGADGTARLDSSRLKAASGDVFTFTVTNLVRVGYSYDSTSDAGNSASGTVP